MREDTPRRREVITAIGMIIKTTLIEWREERIDQQTVNACIGKKIQKCKAPHRHHFTICIHTKPETILQVLFKFQQNLISILYTIVEAVAASQQLTESRAAVIYKLNKQTRYSC